MATRCIRIGSADNVVCYDDGDHDSAVETDQSIKAGVPSDGNGVLRVDDLFEMILPPEDSINIDNPTELNLITGDPGIMLLVYEEATPTAQDDFTLYAYDEEGPAVDAPYVMDAAGPTGNERWIAIAGKYSALDFYLNKLTASLLLSTDADKKLTSVADLTNWIAGVVNQITVTDDLDGTVTLSLPQNIDTDADVEFDSVVFDDLTASRIVKTDAGKKSGSVTNLTDFIAGTANEIDVADDGDGTVTISGDGSDTDFTVVTAIQAGGAGVVGFQYKTRALTLNGGIITTVGAESGWNDV